VTDLTHINALTKARRFIVVASHVGLIWQVVVLRNTFPEELVQRLRCSIVITVNYN
jgi:hypothetical protein